MAIDGIPQLAQRPMARRLGTAGASLATESARAAEDRASVALTNVGKEAEGRLPGGRVAKWKGEASGLGSKLLIDLADRFPRATPLGYKIYGWMTRNPGTIPLQRFGALGGGVFRGAEPTAEGFQQLAQRGVTTVINLRPETDAEKRIVASLGMKSVLIPLPPLDAPTNEQTLEFLKTALDPANGKVFFHCYHGVDRTGTMAAAIRIARDGWSTDRAIAELREFGFHEAGQQPKLAYIRQFEAYWKSLGPEQQAEVLHRPVNAQPGARWSSQA